ncbi:MAG: hypothetical protein JWP12_1710 [Bacteroidetes bacterium]|nr:hypothetical protein [Bacteroidota bacterium]
MQCVKHFSHPNLLLSFVPFVVNLFLHLRLMFSFVPLWWFLFSFFVRLTKFYFFTPEIKLYFHKIILSILYFKIQILSLAKLEKHKNGFF